MVERIAGEGQPPALDGVGEQHGWPVGHGVGLGKGGQQLGQVVPGQVGQQARQGVVRDVGQGGTKLGRVGPLADQAGP